LRYLRRKVRRAKIGVILMQALAGYRRRSAMVLAVLLLGALFTVPSAGAQNGGGADQAARGVPIQRFLALSTNPKDNAKPILLGFGPIHAKGVDRAVTNHKDVFRFPNGSLIVRHQAVSHARSHDKATCFFRFSERGTYRVVRGTGAYAGAHGHGDYRVHVQFVACKNQGGPHAFMLEIRAHGPLRL
jgi:hypothetical protein